MPRCSLGAKAAVLMVALNVSACSKSHCSSPDASDSQLEGAPIDPQLLAFLSRAKSAHHVADLREETDALAAVRALDAVVSGPTPPAKGVLPTEAREVLADTQARIAELQSRLKQFDAASQRIDLALKLVPETSYYRGHLFETRGIVEQRRSEAMHLAGDAAASEQAKLAALSAFETAMQIQAEVIRRAPMRTRDDPSALSAPSSSSPISPAPSTEGTQP